MVMFLCHPTEHTQMLCIPYPTPPQTFPLHSKLSRLACSICEYLKGLPEEENEAGISPSREVDWYPGGRHRGRKSLRGNKTKVKYKKVLCGFVTAEVFKKLSCMSSQQHLQRFFEYISLGQRCASVLFNNTLWWNMPTLSIPPIISTVINVSSFLTTLWTQLCSAFISRFILFSHWEETF